MEQDPQAPEPAAQPPGTAPPDQPPVAGPGAPPPGAPPAQAPKSNKTLIILVVVFLLLCSCCAIAGGGYMIYDDMLQEMVLAPAAPEPAEEPAEATVEEQALEEWLAWEPTTGDFEAVSPTARQQDIAQEAMAQIHPLLTIDEVIVDPGGYDETDDAFYADEYLIVAHMTEYPEVEILEQVYAPSAEGAADGDPTLDFEDFGEGYLLGTLSDGVEYAYPDEDNVLLDGPPDDTQQLLLVAADQWPGGTVAIVFDDADEEGSVWLAITTWEHVRTSWEFEGVLAKYIVEDGEWILDEYEWTLPE